MARTLLHSSLTLALMSLSAGLPAAETAAPVAQVSPAGTEADAAWAKLDGILKAPGIKPNEDRIGYFKQNEERRRQYRDEGLKFYDQHPQDPRRWEWLMGTLQSAPYYWADTRKGAELMENGHLYDAAIDAAALGRWDALMKGRLGPQFLASHQPASKQRAEYFRREMEAVWDKGMDHNRLKEAVPVTDLYTFVEKLALHAAEPDVDAEWSISSGINRLHTLMRLSNIDVKGQWQLVNTLNASPNQKLRYYAGGMERILQVHETPLDLKLTLMDNKPLNVADWRGKVVLVDFWSTSCSSCIEAMPHLKEVYERYQSKGFELVSVCLDEEKNRGKVADVLKKVGAPWYTAFEPWETTPLRARFGFTFVPVYLLLDQDGKLITTDLYDKERLEKELSARLGAAVASSAN